MGLAKGLSQAKLRLGAYRIDDQLWRSRGKNLFVATVWPRPFFGQDDVHDHGQDDDQNQVKEFSFVGHNYLRFKPTARVYQSCSSIGAKGAPVALRF